MKDIHIRDCKIEPTTKACPECNGLLQKITPKGGHVDFDKFYICSESDCNFVGSTDVEQVGILRNVLAQSGITLVDFTVSAITGFSPTNITFTENSFGLNPQTPVWDFGDGSQGSGYEIVHTYNSPGVYTVSMTIFDETIGEYTVTKENLIEIENFIQPEARFYAIPDYGYNPLTVQFINDSLGSNITGYEWDFGTGDTSNVKSPYYIFEDVGRYDVSLTVHDSRGNNDSTTMYSVVTVAISPPIASFESSVTTGYDPLEVNFINTSTGGPADSFNWDFGDGNSSTDENPTYIYSDSGTYTVTLTVTNSSGFSQETFDIEVLEYFGPPEASMTATTACSLENLPITVNFTDDSTAAGIKDWYWEFGDGNVLHGSAATSHNYLTYGTYDVSLTITDSRDATSTYTTTVDIDIVEPNANFEYVTMGDGLVQFNNLSVGDYLNYYWEFGDGSYSSEENSSHQFDSTSPYNVSLTASNAKSSDIITMTIFAYE